MRLGGRGRNGRRPISTPGGRPQAGRRQPLGEIPQALHAFSGLLFKPVQARAAFPALRRHNSATAVASALVQGMHHSDPRIRMFALQALEGSLYRDVPTVSARALSDRKPEIRLQAVKTLGTLVGTPHGEQARHALVDALKHPDQGVVLQVVKTLGGLAGTPHGEQAKHALLGALIHPDLEVVLAASDEILARRITDDLPNTLRIHESLLQAGDVGPTTLARVAQNLRLLKKLY